MNLFILILLLQIVIFSAVYLLLIDTINKIQIDFSKSMTTIIVIYTICWLIMLYLSVNKANIYVINNPKKIAGYLATTATILFLLFLLRTSHKLSKK